MSGKRRCAQTVPMSLPPTCVMIVDDSSTIRRCAEIFLRQAGYEVILAEDGFDALAKIEERKPDMIFMDVIMPRLDGYQTCALMKRCGRHRETPIVLLTSKDTVVDQARGRLAGSSAHLSKPFTKENLLRAAEAHTHTKAAA
jgi:twitching motility two-component system response regulator PilG